VWQNVSYFIRTLIIDFVMQDEDYLNLES
jgi:hypothetical protein